MLSATHAAYAEKTTQPCQHVGKLHPHPYRFAGNQYFFCEFMATPLKALLST